MCTLDLDTRYHLHIALLRTGIIDSLSLWERRSHPPSYYVVSSPPDCSGSVFPRRKLNCRGNGDVAGKVLGQCPYPQCDAARESHNSWVLQWDPPPISLVNGSIPLIRYKGSPPTRSLVNKISASRVAAFWAPCLSQDATSQHRRSGPLCAPLPRERQNVRYSPGSGRDQRDGSSPPEFHHRVCCGEHIILVHTSGKAPVKLTDFSSGLDQVPPRHCACCRYQGRQGL